MIDIPDILNYGGFGALLIVLVAVGRFVQVQLTRSIEREREITDRAMDRAGKAEGAWREMVESNIATNQKLAGGIDTMCKEIRNGIKQDTESHQAMQIQLSKLEK